MNSELHIDDLPDELVNALDKIAELEVEQMYKDKGVEMGGIVPNIDDIKPENLQSSCTTDMFFYPEEYFTKPKKKPLAERLATDTRHFGGYKRRTRPTKKKRRKKK